MVEILAALITLFGVTVLVLGYILQPLREARTDDWIPAQTLLQAQYEQVLGMLRDLETDWRTGKILEEDYRELRRRYLQEGAALLQALQAGEGGVDWEARVEAAVQARRAQLRRHRK